MEEIAKLIMNYGTSTIIVVLFLWDWITNKKKIAETLEQNTKILEEMRATNCNTFKTLEILQENMITQKDVLVAHDKRVIEIQNSISQINFMLERK